MRSAECGGLHRTCLGAGGRHSIPCDAEDDDIEELELEMNV